MASQAPMPTSLHNVTNPAGSYGSSLFSLSLSLSQVFAPSAQFLPQVIPCIQNCLVCATAQTSTTAPCTPLPYSKSQ